MHPEYTRQTRESGLTVRFVSVRASSSGWKASRGFGMNKTVGVLVSGESPDVLYVSWRRSVLDS